MDTFDTIAKRRSVRSFTGEAIPHDHLEKIVDAGRLAASGNNAQPWDFIVVTQHELIDQMKVAAQWMDKAGAVIAVVMNPVSRWWVEDGSAAVQNMLIAATALGYGSCWLEGYTREREEFFKAILDVPENLRLLTLVPVGIPAEWPEKEKKPLTEVMHWEKY